jgi:ParB family chromosome partitioning protein
MAARKGGLGRGLEALIPVEHAEAGFANVMLDDIDANPQQPRKHFHDEGIAGLAASIKEVGVLQPVVLSAMVDGRYELIAGERRCRAARLAGLVEVPAIVRAQIGAESSLTEALIENVQREDLSPLEEAAAYRQLIDDFGLTHEAVAAGVGKSRSAVTNTLRLLQLPPAIQGMVERRELSAGHARALLALDDAAYAVHIARRCSDEGWSVRQVEDAVRAREHQAAPAARIPSVRPAAIIELETRLAEYLGTRVKIDYGAKGGKLVVGFTSLDDLERIYRKFYG